MQCLVHRRIARSIISVVNDAYTSIRTDNKNHAGKKPRLFDKSRSHREFQWRTPFELCRATTNHTPLELRLIDIRYLYLERYGRADDRLGNASQSQMPVV